MFRAENLHKTFPDPEELHVLKGVSLTLATGESVAIIGKSGEGKSTLLHLLGGLEPPCRGNLFLFDTPITPSNAPQIRNRHMGLIFQNFNLLEEYTLLENVLLPARIGRIYTPQTRQRALFLLEQVGLEERKNHLVKKLSGGEKQRGAIARALLNNPSLILADEPTGSLDQASARMIHDLLFHLCRTENKGLIIVTHDLELAHLCDRILTLREGNLWNS